MANSNLDIATMIKNLLHRSVRLIILLSVLLLVLMPAIDLGLVCLLQKDNIVDSQGQTTTAAATTTTADTSQGSSMKKQVQAARRDPTPPLEIYQRILDTIQNISIPLIGLAIPIVTLIVSLSEVVEKEQQQQIAKVQGFLQEIFHHGASIEVTDQIRSLALFDKVTEASFPNTREGETETPVILSFDVPFPPQKVLPVRGFYLSEATMRFYLSPNDYAYKKADGILYSGSQKEFMPTLQYSFAISDEEQKERAKVFFYSDSYEGLCEMTLKLVIVDWNDTEYQRIVQLLISKQRVENTEKRKVICKIAQASSIKVVREKKRRNK